MLIIRKLSTLDIIQDIVKGEGGGIGRLGTRGGWKEERRVVCIKRGRKGAKVKEEGE